MKDYRTYSFWLETAGDDLTPRPPLDGSVDVDVAILGAGFTGLWTAYYLLKRDPSLKVAVVEKEVAGFGASGRNGGWCFAGFPIGPLELLQEHGYDAARLVSLEMYESVDEVGRVTREEGIDAHYAKGGELEVARAPYDLPKLQRMLDGFRAIGLEDRYRLLDADETRDRINIAKALGAFHNREGAAVQPARLARGLARAVERCGGTIYEQTPVLSFAGNPNPSLITARGTVRAKTVVLAGEAYLSAIPGMERAIIPMTSHIVVTEPLGEDLWEQIRWRQRDVLGGWGFHGAYIQHTADGRIALGPYQGNYPYRSRISDELDHDEAIFAHARQSLVDWFPMLKDVRTTHAWGGVFGIPRDRMPRMTYDPRSGIAAAYGYTGDGVATTNLSGRVLTDLITEADSDLKMLPMTKPNRTRWEPEPLRWMGVTFVRRDRQRVLKKIEREGKLPEKPTLSQRLYDY
jgi:glycine/D-amino acid oxidase-like deaminating enzyme